MPLVPPRRCRVSPREEYHTVRLPKGWTPARILRFADAVNAIGQAQRLGTENAALRRERRALRKALRPIVEAAYATDDLDHDTMNPQYHIEVTITVAEARAAKKALKPRKARRAGRTK